MKLLPTFIGLDRLGPIYRGRAEFRSASGPVGGVLKDDLVLRGRASPDLDVAAFQSMLQTLRDSGIDDIRGNLIVDRGLFQPARLDIGVSPFDEAPEFRYNVIPDALLINMNLLQFDLQSDQSSMKIRTTPALDRVTVVSKMTYGDMPCKQWEDGWVMPTQTRTADGVIEVQLQGTFPKNCTATTHINVIDRADYTDRLFRSLWAKLGGKYSGITIENESAAERKIGEAAILLAEHRSRPLAEVVRDINKPSDNAMARMLYLTLGTLGTLLGGDKTLPTLKKSEQEVRAWFARQGINSDGLVLDNGSGLSRSERIRPSQLAALLMSAGRSNWAPEFMASLPIAGIDGTMRNRLRASPAASRARLKTGTLRDVIAVAGYVPDATGQMCIVVAMLNHPRASSAAGHPVMDALIDWVARADTRSISLVDNITDSKTDLLIEQMKMSGS